MKLRGGYKLMTGKNATLAADEIKKATSVDGLRQTLKNHENHMNSPEAQKALFEVIKRKGWKNDKDLIKITTAMGASNMDEFMKKLEKGELKPAEIGEFVKDKTQGKTAEVPVAPSQQPAPGQKPGQPVDAIDKAKADTIMSSPEGAAYAKVLTKDEQKRLEDVRKAQPGKATDDAVHKAQAVLQKIETAQDEAQKLRTEMMKASTPQEIEKQIEDRKTKIKTDFNFQHGEEIEIVKAEIMQSQPLQEKIQKTVPNIANVAGLNLTPPPSPPPPAPPANPPAGHP